MFPDYTAKDVARFWSKVTKTDNPDDCWNWTGFLDKGGYGHIHINRKVVTAHRTAFVITFGVVPDGLHILHRCDNRRCCNPSHLFLGTNANNVKDRDVKGRNRVGYGERCARSKLTYAQVAEIKYKHMHEGIGSTTLGREYGVNKSTILRIVSEKTWRK